MFKNNQLDPCIPGNSQLSPLPLPTKQGAQLSPPRPCTLKGPPKKVILTLESHLPYLSRNGSGVIERAELQEIVQPIKARVVFFVTVVIFLSTLLAFVITVIGLAFTFIGSEYLVCGAVANTLSLVVAGIVKWAGHPLSHTALLQGYLLVGVLCSLTCCMQMSLVLLLLTLPPPPAFYTAWAWVQFIGGAQVAALVVLVAVVVAGGGVMMVCGGARLHSQRDGAVHAYNPR